ncbi:hypothetical protein SAMN04487943_10772 [Gracilibacillus orientalis]|uniref:Uncharacterized protein n=1 Tax=Gracilibacillus orientalis TaxID=334253 RepID=A0A1I4MTF3_9BACI|nr:hypothetical protein [Gracilibacillus orientalis]SFM06345.1 hypothetical protein SAMN04487943_10772 [Gracilibacillus orientalis]
MLLKNISNSYNLLLSLGAFYVAVIMFLESGVFATFPQEWVGKMPFNNWASLALFAIIIFGLGNAFASTYGFIKKNNKIFILTITMGALFFFCIVIQLLLLGEWYLATVQCLLISLVQILLGSFGLVQRNHEKIS